METKIFKSTLRKLKALSDGTRIKILAMLSVRSMCVCELTHVLGLAQPTVSRHLKQLEDTGFINSRREGNWTIYFLDPEDKVISQLLDIVMANALSELEWRGLKKKLNAVDRNSISGNGRGKTNTENTA